MVSILVRLVFLSESLMIHEHELVIFEKAKRLGMTGFLLQFWFCGSFYFEPLEQQQSCRHFATNLHPLEHCY